MKINLIENADKSLWDSLIQNSDEATIFHSHEWLSVARERWNLIVAVNTGQKTPLAGFVEEIPSYNKAHGNSITPYVGPILARHALTGSNASKHSFSLVSAFEQALIKRDCRPFMTSPWANDLRAFVIGRWNVSLLYTNIIDNLQETNLDDIASNDCKSKIRAAQTRNVRTSITHTPDLLIIDKVLELAGKAYGRQNLDVRFNQDEAKKAFMKMAESGNAYFVTAQEKSGDISCALGVFVYRGRAHFLISGQDREIATPGAVNLALYNALKHAQQNGIKEFDFEGSFLEGVDRFLREFGGRHQPYYEVTPPR